MRFKGYREIDESDALRAVFSRLSTRNLSTETTLLGRVIFEGIGQCDVGRQPAQNPEPKPPHESVVLWP